MNDNHLWWKLNQGYRVNAVDGTTQREEGCACTLHFYEAYPGDRISLLDLKYQFSVIKYEKKWDEKYIYTYAYQADENWTTYYRPESGRFPWQQEDYIFTEECYYRIEIKCMPEYEGGVTDSLDKILELTETDRTEIVNEFDNRRKEIFAAEIEKAVDKVTNELEGANRDKLLIYFLLSDSHYTVNGTWEDTIGNMLDVRNGLQSKGISLDGIIHLGDVTDGMIPAEINSDYVKKCFSDLKKISSPIYCTIGNHDSNYFRLNPERFSIDEIKELYLSNLAYKPFPDGLDRQIPEQCYYEINHPNKKLRMIFLNSFNPAEEVRYGYDDVQLNWLEDRLEDIRSNNSDWKVIIFSHVPPTPRLHVWNARMRGWERLKNILSAFQADTNNLIAFVHGHNHADQIDEEDGYKIVSIGCNKCEYFEDHKPEGATAYPRKKGTVSQDLWDIAIINPDTKQIKTIRFGAGCSK